MEAIMDFLLQAAFEISPKILEFESAFLEVLKNLLFEAQQNFYLHNLQRVCSKISFWSLETIIFWNPKSLFLHSASFVRLREALVGKHTEHAKGLSVKH